MHQDICTMKPLSQHRVVSDQSLRDEGAAKGSSLGGLILLETHKWATEARTSSLCVDLSSGE